MGTQYLNSDVLAAAAQVSSNIHSAASLIVGLALCGGVVGGIALLTRVRRGGKK